MTQPGGQLRHFAVTIKYKTSPRASVAWEKTIDVQAASALKAAALAGIHLGRSHGDRVSDLHIVKVRVVDETEADSARTAASQRDGNQEGVDG